ncbi:MAG: hypothetical protein UZ03_NOB001000257, partial [Nitrospira sp. OLB3]
ACAAEPNPTPPQPASQASLPPAPPPKLDPGILKQPDHLPPPNPEAVVPPPVVDPEMAVDPEKSLRWRLSFLLRHPHPLHFHLGRNSADS